MSKTEIDLSKFSLTRILNNDIKSKKIHILGTFPHLSETDQAILTFEKLSFSEENFMVKKQNVDFIAFNDFRVKKMMEEENQENQNDIYNKFFCHQNPEFNYLKLITIYPATQKHIERCEKREFFLVRETPEMYKNTTLKKLIENSFTLDWVYNILEHKKEKGKIIFEDPDPQNGFILLPDNKWDETLETLHLLAIVFDRTLTSLRDLNESHLNMLKNVRDKSLEIIERKFNLPRSQVRAFFHYQPSFYHLHVHFTNLKFETSGSDRNHLLDTVIDNISLLPNYYQKSTLTFLIGDSPSDSLYQAYKSILKVESSNEKLMETSV